MSIDNTDDLKHTWQADTDRALQGRDCPDNERIFDAVAGTLPVSERRKLIAHTSVCGACAQAWRVALELQRAMPADTSSNVRQLPARARFPTRAPTWALAAAAAVTLALGVAWLLPLLDGPFGGGMPDQPVLRGVEDQAIELLIPDRTEINREALVLSWRSAEEVIQYRVRISDAELNVLYASATSQTRLRIPPEVLASVDTGAELFWQVTAELPDGETARSPTGTIIVNPQDN